LGLWVMGYSLWVRGQGLGVRGRGRGGVGLVRRSLGLRRLQRLQCRLCGRRPGGNERSKVLGHSGLRWY